MRYAIHGDKLQITESIKDYIIERLDKLNKYIEEDVQETVMAHVTAKIQGHDQKIEVTIPIKHLTLRAEATNDDLYAAIDLVLEKLESQIKKNKERIRSHNKKHSFKLDYIDEVHKDSINEQKQIVKRKKFEMKPIDEEEAILQMNLIGHSFFVYKDVNSDSVNVLYKKKNGDFGIIETS